MKKLSQFTIVIVVGIVLAVVVLLMVRRKNAVPMSPEYLRLGEDIQPIQDECQGTTRVYDLPIKSNQLIGLVYPPRLGPLHTNVEIKSDLAPCTSPFAEIYDDKVIFRCQPNV